MDSVDKDVFRAATVSFDEYTDSVTSYIHYSEDSIVPTHTKVSFNTDKPWFTAKLRELRLEKEAAFRSGMEIAIKWPSTGLEVLNHCMRNFNNSAQLIVCSQLTVIS